MALPDGVTTATVTAGVPVTHTGAPVKAFVSIEPSVFLVHTATGTPLVDFLEELSINEGVAGQFTLPHTDQAGFQDENGNAYTNWYYTARISYSTPSKAKTKAPKIKVFQLATGQTLVDLDQLPGGAPALPYTAPIATVTSFAGRTGPVELLDGDLPERLSDTSLSATINDKVSAALGSGVVSPFFQKVDLLTFGHSFVAGTPEITAPEYYYRALLAKSLGMTHPTAADSTNLQFAVGGLKAEQLAQRIIGSAPYPNPRRGVALMQLFMNTARVRGADATTLKGARQALRTMIAVVSAESRVEHTNVAVWTAESGTWTTSSSANYSGGSYKQTIVQNSYVDIVLPAKTGTGVYHLMTLGRTGAGPVIEVRNVTLGTVITNVDTSNHVFSGDSPTAVNYALPINAAAGETVRITKTDATANPLVLDTLLVPAANPNPIIGMKDPYLADYSLSTSFPNGSDAALDAFNALWDEMAAQYDNVIVADPNKGYWNKLTDIGADGVHPNEQGNAHLAACARDALLGYALQKSIALVTTGKTPAIDNNVTPITTYASDEFARADSATVGSTEVGAYAWTANPVGDQAKWSIVSQQLVKSGAALTGAKEILVDTTRADGKVGVTFISAVASGCGLSFRVAADGNSGYLVHTLTDGTYLLRRRSGTTYTTLYTSAVGIAAAGDRVEVLMAGSSLSLIVNGTTLGTVTSSTNSTATRHGMWANSSSLPTYDTFKHTSA